MLESDRGRGVVFVSTVGQLGGSAQSLLTLLRHLAPRVRRVVVSPTDLPLAATVRSEGLAERVEDVAGATASRLVQLASVTSRIGAATIRDPRRFPVIHANSVSDAALIAASPRTPRQVIAWAHDGDPQDLATRRSRLVPLLHALGRRIQWVAVSQASAQALAALGYASSDQISVIPNPIDPATTLAERTPADRVRIGYVGAATERKGFDVLPAIARSIDPRRSVLLVFSNRRQAMSAAESHTWEELDMLSPDRVEIRGRQADIRTALASCDIVVCPTRHESFCRAAAEAMLNGIPVVARDIPAVSEVVGTSAGTLVPPDKEDGFASAVRELVDDGALRAQMGEHGRARARQFDPQVIAAAFERLYGFSSSKSEPPHS